MGVYKWKDGSRFKADPEKVAKELNALPEKTPEAALKFAKNKKTELHKCATWDDAKAAHLYRLDEMRAVIRSVVIVDDEDENREPVIYRAYEYVVVENAGEIEKVFMPTSEILSDPDLKKQVFEDISASISELSRKAKLYRYLAEQEFDKVQYHLDMAREVVATV